MALVGYWPLDDPVGTVAADALGVSPGTHGTGVLSGQVGLVGSGAVLYPGTGAGQTVVTQNATINAVADPVSIGFWVKRSRTATQEALFYKGESGPFVSFGSDDTITFAKNAEGTIAWSTAAGAVTDTTRWHHVACTKSGTTVRVYRDGVDFTQPNVDRTLTTNTTDLTFGGIPAAVIPFQGLLDDIRFDNAAWTAAEVYTLWLAGSAASYAPRRLPMA